MARLLFSIKDIMIEGDELVLIPGFEFQENEQFHSGDPIFLKRPNGSEIEWKIGGFTLQKRNRFRNDVCIVLKGLSKDDIPIGTEVWSEASQLLEHKPEPAHPFPNRVLVQVNHPRAEGLAVSIRFGMSKKNDYYYTVFLDSNGCVEISGEELLRSFDKTGELAIMDFVNPRGGFTGQIKAEICDESNLQNAINGFKLYRDYYPFPKGYEQNLKSALARGQNPEDYHVELEVEYEK